MVGVGSTRNGCERGVKPGSYRDLGLPSLHRSIYD